MIRIITWQKSEDIDWVSVKTKRVCVDLESSPAPSSLTVAAPAESVEPSASFAVEDYQNADLSKRTSLELEKTCQLFVLQGSCPVPNQLLTREWLTAAKKLVEANWKVGLAHLVAPLVQEGTYDFVMKLLPSLSFCNEALQMNFLASLLLNVDDARFTEGFVSFWLKCLLNKRLETAFVESFLLQVDGSAHSRLFAAIVFAVVKANAELAQRPLLRSLLSRSPTSAPMLFPAKKLLEQLKA